MATAQEAVYGVLSTYSGLIALVPILAIVPEEEEQETPMPCVVWREISTEPQTTHGEPSADQYLDKIYIQVDCFAVDVLTAKQILFQVRKALDASNLSASMVASRTLPREDDALSYGASGDWVIFHRPS